MRCSWSAAIWFGCGLSSCLMVSLVQLHSTWWLSTSNRLWQHYFSISFEGSFCHLEESIFDLSSIGGTSFKEHHIVVVLGPLFSLNSGDGSLSLQVKFVSNANEWEWIWVAWACILIESISPFFKILETLWVGDVIAKSTTIGTSVKSITQWLKLFLTGSVPDL